MSNLTEDVALPLPYISRLSEKIKPGQTLMIHGVVDKNCTSFQVNLLSGTGTIDLVHGKVVLHVDVRFSEKKVVMNSMENGTWGKEERVSNPFEQGKPFDLRIRALEDKFEISANHKEIHEFKYRYTLDIIDHLNILGDISLTGIHWGGRFYSLPYESGFPRGRLQAGDRVLIYGTPTGKRFEINFIGTNGDILFHFNPRLNEGVVVRNSEHGSEWKQEEREGGNPFKKDTSFDLVIVNEPYSIQIFVDNKRFATFAHLTASPSNDYANIRIDGELELTGLEFKHI